MAKLVIDNHTEFFLFPESDDHPRIPYYKVFVQVIGKQDKIQGEVIFNWEDENFNLRWISPNELDEIDQIWDEKICVQVRDYLIKKTGKIPLASGPSDCGNN